MIDDRNITHLRLKPAEGQRGFVMFEICIILCIAMLLVTAGVSIYDAYLKEQYVLTLKQRYNDINNAIVYYAKTEGVLPCPADPTIPNPPAGTSLFGVSVCPPGQSASVPASIAQPTGPNGPVLIGAVPVRTLGLPDVDIAEPYGYRFIYAATEALTKPSSATINPQPPYYGWPDSNLSNAVMQSYDDFCSSTLITCAITVNNPLNGGPLDPNSPVPGGTLINANNSPPTIEGSAWIVVTTGRRGLGAYGPNGTITTPCSAGPPSPDQENCNGDTVFNYYGTATNGAAMTYNNN